MLTTRKINNRNKSNKCNYQWLVYEHSHDDIMSCEGIGHKMSVIKMGIHDTLSDVWDNKEIKWQVGGYNDLKICRLKSRAWETITSILIKDSLKLSYYNEAIKLKFYLIDNNGKKVTKHPILV